MTTSEYIHGLAVRAKAAAGTLARLTTAEKNAALLAIADALEANKAAILAANGEDVAAFKVKVKGAIERSEIAEGLREQRKEDNSATHHSSLVTRHSQSEALLDRLTLTEARFAAMVAGVRHIAELPDPVGEEIWKRERPSGITIRKVRVPFGVVAVVFESRPNVFIDTAALCLKTGNAIILRGGKEALRTNAVMAKVVRECLREVEKRGGGGQWTDNDSSALPSTLYPLPSAASLGDVVQFVEITDHAAVTELVRAVGLVDVAIPRGGERLIRAMCEAALVPVLKHYKGVCHIYVDDKADLAMALAILDNAKTQRPGVCNAAECLLIHERLAPMFMPMVKAWAADKGVVLHVASGEEVEKIGGGGQRNVSSLEERVIRCPPLFSTSTFPSPSPKQEIDWEREFLALEMNVGVVADVGEAIAHINRYSSHHSECIVTDDAARAAQFLRDVDSACVYHNVSTRFTDGGEFGMGAEIGISTDKLHARGPMGLEELTTYKYAITGDGVIRK